MIQKLLAEGYASVQIKEMLNTTYNRIRRYATGDPFKLCRFGGDRTSEADRYKEAIIALLTQNVSFKHALGQISAQGYHGKRTAFEVYCRKLIAEHGILYTPRRNAAGAQAAPNRTNPVIHYVSKTDFMRYLWSGKEIELADISVIFEKYPQALEIQQCILDFRRIYAEKDITLLEHFIERYSGSQISPIKAFVSGLRGDWDAVKNSVISDLSNGFVEGCNNKIKLIKRTMYGRAKIDLLRVKVLHAR
jgi:transposase